MDLKKFLFALSTFILTSLMSNAQNRVSPPAETKATVNGAEVVINYSQPSVKGRTIFGDLVPLNQVWRTGANEATTFEISKDVKIEGKDLKAGKYSVFTIPGEKEWTIIFDSKLGQWGAYSYDSGSDVLRVKVKPTDTDFTETFTINANNKGSVSLAWEKTRVSFNIK